MMSREYLLCMLGMAMATARPGVMSAQQVAAAERPAEVADTLVLTRLVTVQLQHVPLQAAIVALGDAARVRLVYRKEMLDAVARDVTLQVKNMPLSKAFEQLLNGTLLVAVAGQRDIVSIEPAGTTRRAMFGSLRGTVFDATTKRPISGARLSVEETKLAARSGDDGSFRISSLTAGSYRIAVRRIGYHPFLASVTIKDDTEVSLTVPLALTANVLNNVVTTAVGERRRVELGNSIGTIQADSVVKTTLIRNVSDLLQARTPGVIVSNSSGMVGAPSTIRIRGTNSVRSNDDPVVIVDGVRIQSQTTGGALDGSGKEFNLGRNQTFTAHGDALAPSRLDDIDPNSIESIDVLKGPSAASLYGTDAANGVIIIKTKRGQPGRWRFDVTANQGWSTKAGAYPEGYYGWGVNGFNNQIKDCFLANVSDQGKANVSDGSCVQDSVTHFNALNSPYLSQVGTGEQRDVSGSLSGGTASVTQYLSASAANDLGVARLSAAERSRLTQVAAQEIPDWVDRPNTQQSVTGTSRTTMRPASFVDLSLTATGTYRSTRLGAINAGLPATQLPDTLFYVPGQSAMTLSTSGAKNGLVSLMGNATPTSWLTTRATGGLDYTTREDITQSKPFSCRDATNAFCARLSAATRTIYNQTIYIPSFDVGATASFAITNWLQSATAIGEQYRDIQGHSLKVGNGGSTLAFGSTLLSPSPTLTSAGAQAFLVEENRDESATAGWYLQQTFSLASRLFMDVGFRRDVASSFGSNTNEKAPVYPKLSFSWLVSQEPFFPKSTMLSNLRVRSAFGHAGVQSRQDDILGAYTSVQTQVDGALLVGVQRTGVGNPDLKPERSEEWEGGIDASLFSGDRVNLEFTMYRKRTKDMIVQTALAPSYGNGNFNNGGQLSLAENLGLVQNRGVEVHLDGKILDTRPLAWNLSVNYSRNTNKLLRAGGAVSNGAYSVFREGYPLYGFFGYRVLSYADRNGNGILSDDEITFTGDQTYFGSTLPKYEMTYTNTISVLNGSVRLGISVDQINGQTNPVQVNNNYGFGERCLFDRHCSVAQQAVALEALKNHAWYPTANVLRLNEMSLTYTVPVSISRRWFHTEAASVTFAGRNLGLWTNYIAGDPNVNSNLGGFGDDITNDGSALPQPRNWTFRLNLGF